MEEIKTHGRMDNVVYVTRKKAMKTSLVSEKRFTRFLHLPAILQGPKGVV